MYSAHGYGHMLTDEVRRRSYMSALEAIVRPGMVVAEIGTGLGYFALACARLGASRVYAFEASASAARLAADVIQGNGTWPIQIIQADSRQVALTERVDLVLSDLRGGLPFFDSHLATISDARRRFLKEGGTLIAEKDRLFVALASAEATYDHVVDFWRRIPGDVDFACVRWLEANRHHRVALTAENLLSDSLHWQTVDYRSVGDEGVIGRGRVTASGTGACHGLVVWFDCDLGSGISFSNSPEAPSMIYGQVLFPFPEPLNVSVGDVVDVALDVQPLPQGYAWTWEANGAGRRLVQSQVVGQVART